MTQTLTQPSLEPHIPRLVRTWDGSRGGADAIEIDGTLVSVDLSGFTALSERLAAKGRAGAEEPRRALSPRADDPSSSASHRGRAPSTTSGTGAPYR